jgi:hypothetical protein
MNPEERKKVSDEPCGCIRCSWCAGSGSYWLDMHGKYLGQSRRDDLDELEICEECGGSGIVESCDRCQLLQEDDWNNP